MKQQEIDRALVQLEQAGGLAHVQGAIDALLDDREAIIRRGVFQELHKEGTLRPERAVLAWHALFCYEELRKALTRVANQGQSASNALKPFMDGEFGE